VIPKVDFADTRDFFTASYTTIFKGCLLDFQPCSSAFLGCAHFSKNSAVKRVSLNVCYGCIDGTSALYVMSDQF
jgi:hypothetical protein